MKYFVGLCSVFAMFYSEINAMARQEIDPWEIVNESIRMVSVHRNDITWQLNSAMDNHLDDIVKILTKVASQNHFFGWSKNQKANLLFYAVENGLEEVVKDCAKEHKSENDIEDYIYGGFDLDVRDKYGKTPLLVATDQGYNSIAESLLKYGADPDVVDLPTGFSPLMLASWIGNKSLVNTLIKYQAKVDTLSHWGCSPLSLAMGSNHKSIVKILLNAGADIDLVNQNGDTPRSIALYYRHKLADSIKEKARWNTMIKVLEKWSKRKQEVTVTTPIIKSSFHSFFRSIFKRKN